MLERLKDVAKRKREELEAALRKDDIADPISILISVGISVAASAASYAISRALAPKPPRQEFGRLNGTLQIQNSEQGIFIPEIYGGPPDFTGTIVAGSNPTYQNVTNATTGANGSITKTSGSGVQWDAGATHATSVVSGDEAFFKVIRGTGHAAIGFFTSATASLGAFLFGAYWTPDGQLNVVYNGASQGPLASTVSGDLITVELRDSRFKIYKNSADLAHFPTAPPVPSYPLWMGIIMYSSGSGISDGKVQINNIGDQLNAARGGIKVPAIIIWTSGIRKNVNSVVVQQSGGKGGGSRSTTADEITYDIDLALMYGRGPLSLIREYANADILIDQNLTTANPSGVYDPGTGADPVYDPLSPPDPLLAYKTAEDRVNADISFDGDGVGTGNIQGGGSPFAIYPGNTTQQPDPIIEADIDARYGTGSTPAYKNHAYITHNDFSLSRWSGIVPNFTSVWEHQTLKNLDDIFGSLCDRVQMSAYDFSGVASIPCRGLLIAGRLFRPAEVIGSPEIETAYNYFVTEAEGQVIAYAEGTEPSVTISDSEVGWLEGDDDDPDIIPEVDSLLATEVTLPRQIDVKYLDPDNDWEPNTQNAHRQITDGESIGLLEVQVALLANEARAAAQRKLYRDYVAGTAHKFTLPWTYLYLYPGYKIIITRAEGFTHTIRLTSISGGIGVLECEGFAIEPTSFTQPANGVFPPGYIPPQPIPAMTIMQLLDTPLIRDGDETVNNGVGRYVAGVPRTGVNQTWTGFVLYARRRNTWEVLIDSSVPATVGTIVTANNLYPTTGIYSFLFTVDSVTDIFTATGNLLADGDQIVVGNTGGALPAPLVAGTVYFVRDKSGDTFKLAATSGGVAIDITTNGSGSNSIFPGTMEIDLYGTTATLESVSDQDVLEGGKNLSLGGDLVFNFASATQVAGFPNRWLLTRLLTGQKDTEDKLSTAIAGNRFMLLNEAVRFAPMLVEDVDVSIDYRAVSIGQSLGDAATIANVWDGNTLRPRKVVESSISVVRDGSGDFKIQFMGRPRASELPETYSVEVWRDTDRSNSANLLRTLPLTDGTSHAVILRVPQGEPIVT